MSREHAMGFSHMLRALSPPPRTLPWPWRIRAAWTICLGSAQEFHPLISLGQALNLLPLQETFVCSDTFPKIK